MEKLVGRNEGSLAEHRKDGRIMAKSRLHNNERRGEQKRAASDNNGERERQGNREGGMCGMCVVCKESHLFLSEVSLVVKNCKSGTRRGGTDRKRKKAKEA